MSLSLNKDRSRAERNRTIELAHTEFDKLRGRLLKLQSPVDVSQVVNKTICQDLFDATNKLPSNFVDLLVIDPPYNLHKEYNGNKFSRMNEDSYENWFRSWFEPLLRVLKQTASVYVCSDWTSSSAIYRVLNRFLKVRNRITWEREKGRGAKSNWKNCSEDIWFATVSQNYYFDPEAVKLKRKVIAPYKVAGRPKDWKEEDNGNYRLTFPSNFWSDITIPFWSMPENTDHPTQKPEKLIAKLILASSQRGDFVLDPFLGSGTTSIVAKKLERRYCGIEINEEYACLTEKRLELANSSPDIQGYSQGVFWERNSLSEQGKSGKADPNQLSLTEHDQQ